MWTVECLIEIYRFIFQGSAWCLAYIPGHIAITFYFPSKYHGIVIGICSAGTGLGAFMAPLSVEWLSEHYGWRGAMIIQAAINLNLLACGMALIPKPGMRQKQDYFQFRLLRNPYYVDTLLAIWFAALGLSVVFVHLAYGVETFLNVGTFESSLVVTMTGLGSFIGRIAQGVIASIPRVNLIYQFAFSHAAIGVMVLVLPSVKSLALMMAIALAIGLGIGAFGTVPALILTRFLPAAQLTSGFGYQQFTIGFGLVVGAPLAGLMYDRTGNYATSLYSGGALLIVAALTFLAPICFWNKYLLERSAVVLDLEEGAFTFLSFSIHQQMLCVFFYIQMPKLQTAKNETSSTKNRDRLPTCAVF